MKITATAIIGILVLLTIIFAGNIIELYTGWLWFSEVDYASVFKTVLACRIILGAGVALLAFILIYGNVLLTRPLMARTIPDTDDDVLKFPGQNQAFTRYHHVIPWIIVFFCYMVGSTIAGFWPLVLSFFHQVPFGKQDPVFAKDLSFYIFSLPFYKALMSGISTVAVFSLLFSTVSYILNRNIQWRNSQKLWVGKGARSHILILCAVIFAAKGWGYWLVRYDTLVLFASGHVVSGATFTDVHFKLPALMILSILCAGFCLGCLAAAFKPGGKFWVVPAAGVAALFVFYTLGTRIIPDIVQKFKVLPNELVAETPYIERNIRMTREAFKLEGVEERPFNARGTLGTRDIARNRATIDNIRLWDHRPLLATFGQLQEIRTYYSFANVDNDRYMIDGRYRQVMLSARELDSAKLPSRIWINEHLTYTHGYGMVMGLVSESTPEGLPTLLIKDLPPSAPQELKVSRPEIYYGELSNQYAIANTKSKELDYPSGDENVYTNYSGSGGVLFSSFWRKLAFVSKFKSLKILLSNDITKKSRILFNRNITQRAAMVAPFLRYDRDPYLVLFEERLFWIIDAYTYTSHYPYSMPLENGINYIRNSVKTVIDAYDGNLSFYVADDSDPLLKTYRNIFPALFKDMSEMPEGLRAHLRFPKDIFEFQSHVYSRYHMTDIQVFYNQEDLWTVPNEILENTETVLEPYYTIMKLPGETKEEYILMLPLTPSKRDNMIAWMAARSDYPNTGEILVYRFPKESLIYGPMQIEARINQDAAISQQFTLWGQRGTRIIRGSIMAIPIEDSLIYVEPIYLQAELGKIPELRRIIVAYGEKIAMEKTLDEALSRVISAKPGVYPAADSGKVIQTPKRALELYLKAQEKIKKGDWAGYGEAVKELGKVLEKINK